MSVVLTYAFTLNGVETLAGNTDPFSSSKRVVTWDAFNESGQLTSSSSPPVTTVAAKVVTLSSGTLTIDVTALTGYGANGSTVNATGLRLQMLRVKNLGAAALSFEAGASNGYDGLGAAVYVVGPGQVVQQSFSDPGGDISASNKTIDLTGTGAQTSEWTFYFG